MTESFNVGSKWVLNKKCVLKSVLVKICVLKIHTYQNMYTQKACLTGSAYLKHVPKGR